MEFIPIGERVEALKEAISRCIMLDAQDWMGRDSKDIDSLYSIDILYARVLFASECIKMRIRVKAIAKELGVNHSTISYYSRRYNDLKGVDERFRSFEIAVLAISSLG